MPGQFLHPAAFKARVVDDDRPGGLEDLDQGFREGASRIALPVSEKRLVLHPPRASFDMTGPLERQLRIRLAALDVSPHDSDHLHSMQM